MVMKKLYNDVDSLSEREPNFPSKCDSGNVGLTRYLVSMWITYTGDQAEFQYMFDVLLSQEIYTRDTVDMAHVLMFEFPHRCIQNGKDSCWVKMEQGGQVQRAH